MTYQPKVYREQGGNKLVVASGGSLQLDSGSSCSMATNLEVASGGSLAVASGGNIAVASGGAVTVAAGAYQTMPYQTLTSTQTGTAINTYGVTMLGGTTTGPTYTLAAPSAAGQFKWLILNPSSSGATHRCVVSSSAWSGKITHHSATGDKITLNTSAQWAAMLVASGTTEWRVTLAYGVKEPAIS
jgi:hypothetical protein